MKPNQTFSIKKARNPQLGWSWYDGAWQEAEPGGAIVSITGVTMFVYVTADTLLSPQTVSLILSLLVNLSAVYRGHDDGIEQKFSPSHKIKVSILKVPLRFGPHVTAIPVWVSGGAAGQVNSIDFLLLIIIDNCMQCRRTSDSNYV